jgi:Icc-related predicted phosphoesterase
MILYKRSNEGIMKVIAISDTHGQHIAKSLVLDDADMIIHAGDISLNKKERSVIDFLNWYSSLDYKYKIFIAGNHDFFFEKEKDEKIKNLIPQNIIYLNDSGVNIEGINIWGSPIQPLFYNWAFNRRRGAEISKHWELIPENTDILITHGPPFSILDKTTGNDYVGCKDLLVKLNKIKPKFHIFGHIHEGYGQIEKEGTIFINASLMTSDYKLKNKPILFEV